MSTPDEDAELEARLAALEMEVDAEHEAAQKAYAEAEEELGLGPKARAKRKAAEAAAARAAAEEARGPPCRLAAPDAEGARKVHVPCVHCRELRRFRLRQPKDEYSLRCPECRTRYVLEVGTVTRAKAGKKLGSMVGMGMVGLLASAAGSATRFRLRVAIAGADRERDVDFLGLNPLAGRDFFEQGDVVGLVHRDDELVAVANYACESWLTTRAGGLEGLFGTEGRDREADAADEAAERRRADPFAEEAGKAEGARAARPDASPSDAPGGDDPGWED